MMLRDELRKIESSSDDFFLEHGEDFYPASMEDVSTPQDRNVVMPAVQEHFGRPETVEEMDSVDWELAELFGQSAPQAETSVEAESSLTDAEQLFQEIAAETSAVPRDRKNTLRGLSGESFKADAVDDMAKTIVMDEAEMARISKE
jgi:hypothetical protein